MNAIRRLTTLIGVIALMASSLLAGGAMAQIGTTITVNNEPACPDEALVSLVLNQGAESVTWSTLASGNSTNTNNLRLRMDLSVDECFGQGWRVDVAVSDFTNAPHPPVASAGRLMIFADNNLSGNGWVQSYMRPVYLSEPESYLTTNQVPGTTGLETGWPNSFNFVAASGGGSVANKPLSTGTTESFGDMVQVFRLRVHSVPNTTPAGTYSGTLTLTFTPTGSTAP